MFDLRGFLAGLVASIVLGSLGDRLYPGGTSKPFARSHPRATSAADAPSAIAAFISRRSDVRSSADTAFRASASPGPNDSSAVCETTGVTFSDGLQVAIVE